MDAPVESILTCAMVCPLVYHFPLPLKTGLLLISSIYHLRHDVSCLNANIFMHLLWIQQPIIAELYLSFIHTPRHYRTIVNGFKLKLMWITAMTIVTCIDMVFKYTDRLTPLWWVGPVLVHIYMTDYIPNITNKW